MSEEIKELEGTPRAFAAVEAKINELISRLRPLLNLEVRGTADLKQSRSNAVLTVRGGGAAGRQYFGSITVAGSIPTSTEIATAMALVYTTAATTPGQGDTVFLTVSSVVKFQALVRTSAITGATASVLYVSFTGSSVTYYAVLTQVGLY